MPTQLTIDEKALIPAIAQDADTGAVLMVAYMNHESLTRTIESGQAWFYSRSRQELWHKGATSGHFLNVVEIRPDCDGDVILLKVNPEGPACHTGNETCFYQDFDTSDWQMEPINPGPAWRDPNRTRHDRRPAQERHAGGQLHSVSSVRAWHGAHCPKGHRGGWRDRACRDGKGPRPRPCRGRRPPLPPHHPPRRRRSIPVRCCHGTCRPPAIDHSPLSF